MGVGVKCVDRPDDLLYIELQKLMDGSFDDKKYPIDTLCTAITKLTMIKQQENEGITDYVTRFKNTVSVLESIYGKFKPQKCQERDQAFVTLIACWHCFPKRSIEDQDWKVAREEIRNSFMKGNNTQKHLQMQ